MPARRFTTEEALFFIERRANGSRALTRELIRNLYLAQAISSSQVDELLERIGLSLEDQDAPQSHWGAYTATSPSQPIVQEPVTSPGLIQIVDEAAEIPHTFYSTLQNGNFTDIFEDPVSKEERAQYDVWEKDYQRIRSEEQLRDMEADRNSPNRRSREATYMNQLRTKKKQTMSVEELVESEVPILVRQVPDSLLQTAALRKSVNGLTTEKGVRSCTCSQCGIPVPPKYAIIVLGTMYCPTHAPRLEMCESCYTLQTDCARVRTYDSRDIWACTRCRSRSRCERCHNSIGPEMVETGYCIDCLDRENNRDRERRYSYRMTWVSNDTGAIISSPRVFSAEIEAYTNEDRIAFLVKNIPREMGIGGDSSIEPSTEDADTFELQTPRIAGSKAEELLFMVGAALRGAGAQVNDSCGMHIHIDGAGLFPASRRNYPAALVQLLKASLVFEDVILSFLPYSRRDNDFCRPLQERIAMYDVDMARTVLDLEKLWYTEKSYSSIMTAKGQHHHPSRYYGVNFHSLLSDGHLEIRYHSGTTNVKKILEWANLHLRIVDAAANGTFTPDVLRHAQKCTSLRQRTKILFDTIGLSKKSQEYFFARQNKFSKTNATE